MARGRPRKNADDMLLKSAELIGWALGGLEREIAETKNRLTALTAQATALRKRVGGRAAAAAAVAGAAAAKAASAGRKRRNLSADARKRISDRMTKRWAEWRKKNKKSAK
jgi:septal ring factor EnvC (AmiA/AmiB activator)